MTEKKNLLAEWGSVKNSLFVLCDCNLEKSSRYLDILSDYYNLEVY